MSSTKFINRLCTRLRKPGPTISNQASFKNTPALVEVNTQAIVNGVASALWVFASASGAYRPSHEEESVLTLSPICHR